MTKTIEHTDFQHFAIAVNAAIKDGYSVLRLARINRWKPGRFGIGWWVTYHSANLEKSLTLRANFGPVREQSVPLE